MFDTNNNPAEKLYSVEPVEGKGLGLIAFRGLKEGTVILREPCSVSMDHHVMMKERVARGEMTMGRVIMAWLESLLVCAVVLAAIICLGDYVISGGLSLMFLYRVYKCDIYKNMSTTLSAFSLQLSKSTLAQKFDSFDDAVKDQFLSLTNVFSSDSSSLSEKLLGIMCTNSFQLEDHVSHVPSVSHVTSGVFLTAARINHSCRSNADYRLTRDAVTGAWSISVILIRDLAEGEEVTLCYNNFLEDDGPVTRRERRNYLNWAYRFTCFCEDCSLKGYGSKTNDMLRTRIVKARLDWSLTSDLGRERRLVDDQLELLRMLDSAGRLEYVIQAAECGWDSELAGSDWDPVSGRGQLGGEAGARLLRWADTGATFSHKLYGRDSPVTHNWRRRLELIEKVNLK